MRDTYPVHSPDRLWWWDGDRWQPAVSPDGSHWFDGIAWRRRVPQRSSSRPLLIVLVFAGVIVAGIGSMMLYIKATREAHDFRSLDDTRIEDAAAAGCLGVTQALSDASGDREARIANGNAAIDELVRGLEKLDASTLADDDPALEWVADWKRLAVARDAYADRLVENRTAQFQIPQTDDGFPITQRMIDVSPPECEQAVTLASQP